MICVFEASSAVEAHMIINLLEQSEIEAHIHGEHLQGGVGELQAVGIVRVMVNEADQIKAHQIIELLESRQPTQQTDAPYKSVKRPIGIGKYFIGLAIGIVITAFYYNTPTTYDGIDYNGDGVLDEKWVFKHYRMHRTETDRNFDGKVDYIHEFNSKGIIKQSLVDDDFNGTFETIIGYRNGSALIQKSDYDNDGFEEYRIMYTDGVLDKIKYYNPSTEGVIKVQYYEAGKVARSERDSDGDDVIDTITKYDEIEEIVSSESKF